MKVKFVPQNVEFEIKPGESVMHLAQDNGLYIKSVCKGVPSCAECRVRVTEGDHNVLPPGSEELSLIGTGHFIDRRRLSCQLKCFGDITVDMSEQIAKEQGIIVGRKKKLSAKDDRVEAVVRARRLGVTFARRGRRRIDGLFPGRDICRRTELSRRSCRLIALARTVRTRSGAVSQPHLRDDRRPREDRGARDSRSPGSRPQPREGRGVQPARGPGPRDQNLSRPGQPVATGAPQNSPTSGAPNAEGGARKRRRRRGKGGGQGGSGGSSGSGSGDGSQER